MTTPTLPITISSRNFDGTKTTKSINPKTIKRLADDLRRGDGDTILITDAAGNRYDVTDIGHGLQLIANGDRVEAATAAAPKTAPRKESNIARMNANLKILNKATRTATLEYREALNAIKSCEASAAGNEIAVRMTELKAIIGTARTELKALRIKAKTAEQSTLENFTQARAVAQEKRDEAISTALAAFTDAQAALTK